MYFLNNFLNSNSFDNLNKFFARKFFKIFKFFFVETTLLELPETNYPAQTKSLIDDFDIDLNKKPYISYEELLELISSMISEKKFIFYDYGAGNLKLFRYLDKKFDNLNYYFKDQDVINKNVLDVKIKKKLSNLYVNNLQTIDKINLLYFGSSIQYLKYYKKDLSQFFGKAEYILLAQTPFFNNKNKKEIFVIKQLNMHPTINYLYLFNSYYFLEFMENNNYVLIKKKRNKVTKFLNFKNFKKDFHDLDMYDYLFKYQGNQQN
tara:strand:- start:1213 stop:2001 length:789 start_codon:yes stop_codon:yes gene_type:complete